MAGIRLATFGGVNARVQNNTPTPASVTSAAFGPGYTAPASSASMGAALKPDDPFGIAFWIGIAALAGLVFIRQSLPR
jgi:hypothetical protein